MRAIEEMMKQAKLEDSIVKGLKIVQAGLCDEIDLENLDETYVALETDVKTKGYEVYLKDEKVVFAKALNPENNYGRVVYIPEELTDEEYSFLVNRTKKKHSTIGYRIAGWLILTIVLLGIILYTIEILKAGSQIYDLLSMLCLSFFPSLILSILLILKSKDKE